MSDKKQNVLLMVLGGITVLLLIFFIVLRVQSIKAQHELSKSDDKIEKAQAAYDKKKDDVSKKVYYYVSENGDAKTKPIGKQYVGTQTLNTRANTLFKIIYTYSNANDYINRKSKASNLVTTDVLNKQDIFGNKKNASVVKSLGIESSFDSAKAYLSEYTGNELKGIVVVDYSIVNMAGTKEGTKTFNVTYDMNQNKFTAIDIIN